MKPNSVFCDDVGVSLRFFLLQLPTIIADNAGYDSADLVAQLRASHQENKTTFGLSE